MTPEVAFDAAVLALGMVGAWGAVEGLAGNWGVTGRVLGEGHGLGSIRTKLRQSVARIVDASPGGQRRFEVNPGGFAESLGFSEGAPAVAEVLDPRGIALN